MEGSERVSLNPDSQIQVEHAVSETFPFVWAWLLSEGEIRGHIPDASL